MSRFLLVHLMLLLTCIVNAQVKTGSLEFGRNVLSVSANGMLFKQSDTTYLHEYPAGSGNHLLGFQGLWIAAKDNNGDLYTSIGTGKNGLDEFWPGPLDTLLRPVDNPEFWNEVWVVSKEEIDSHKVYWNKSGYTTPTSIAGWPARHPEKDVRPNMAPYADVNLNGIYDPEFGDYPLIEGDIAAYYITNDAYGEHGVSGGLKMNLELHGMSYAYYTGKDSNVLFNEYYLVNLSDKTYDSVLVGVYNDVILGNSEDNYVGSWVDLRTVFSYNGDADDEGHYGTQKPVVALVGLDHEMSASMSFNGGADTNRSKPVIHQEYWNAMNARWRDGRPLTFGSSGRDDQNEVTRWVYPGSTEPSISGNWNDADAGDGPGQRNILGVFGPFFLAPDSYILINTAVIWQTNYEISSFRNRISTLIEDHGTVSASPVMWATPVGMWPNPAISGQLLHFDNKVTKVEIWDMSGRKVLSFEGEKNMQMQCSVSAPQGVYWVKAIHEGGFTWLKLVIQ